MVYMALVVLRSRLKITRLDWLLKDPIFYDVGPIQYDFYLGPVEFWQEDIPADFNVS